jgi:hypothetical protein
MTQFMTLRQHINRVADELHLDLRDPYTRILATAIAAWEIEDARVERPQE